MNKRIVPVLFIAIALVLSQALPAFAISNISNTFTANDYTPATDQVISFSARTNFGWVAIPNPYSSNFVTEVNGSAFNKPVNQSYNVPVSVNWGYYNLGVFTSPAYRFYSGWLGIVPTQNYYVNFTAKAKNLSGQYRHRHGQSTELNWDISYGSPAWVTTSH